MGDRAVDRPRGARRPLQKPDRARYVSAEVEVVVAGSGVHRLRIVVDRSKPIIAIGEVDGDP
jgi:hypothetical protein